MQDSSFPTTYPREWIQDSAGLKRAAAAVGRSPQVYLDLEADSMHHYFAKICLVQVLADDVCYLIDPLAADMQPLLQALAQKSLVMHGADYDLRMLYQQHGFRPKEVFDTMLAAQLLGMTSFGLASLIRDFFGVVIPKEGQKADWSRRPLPESLLEYAAQDTHYLPGLYATLTRELHSKGRGDWHRESCASLVLATERIRENDPDAAWRISGSSRLQPRQLAALKALWEVREAEARARDLPPYRVLPSEILLRFAEATPREGRPQRIPKLPSRLGEELRQRFLNAYDQALETGSWPLPRPPQKKFPKSPHPDLLAELRDIRDRLANELKLDPSLLAPRATLLAVALTGLPSAEEVREAAQWMRWQESLLLEPWMAAAQRYRKAV